MAYRFTSGAAYAAGLFLVGVVLTTGIALGQSSTSVENLTSLPASRLVTGLGFNIHEKNEWEFQMAHDAGATEVRMGPGWNAVEVAPGKFVLPASTETALDWCAKYGLQPLFVAAYGPRAPTIATLTVAQDVPAGAKSIPVVEDVSAIHPPACHVMLKSGLKRQIVPNGKWAYYGALIDSVDLAARALRLAAATSVPLAKGDVLQVNQLLHPSCATSDPRDPSIVAYGRYVSFLAGRIAAHGLRGRVEIWNEPPWAHDPWDCRARFYDADSVPPGLTHDSPNFGLAEMLVSLPAPPGVHYNWGGSHKSGFRSLLSKYLSPPLTPSVVADTFDSESFHPYGNSPEDAAWDPAALAALPDNAWIRAGLPGTNWGGNFKSARKLLLERPGLNFQQNVTETGIETSDGARKARFCLRQYLAFLAIGIERVTFFCFSTPDTATKDDFGFVDQKTQVPTQAYTALKDLMTVDLARLPAAPLPYSAADLPAVPSYQGTYPLDLVSIVGRHAGADQHNAIFFVAWQRSHPPPGPVIKLAASVAKGSVTLIWPVTPYASLTPPSNVSTVARATVSGGPYTPLATLPTQPDMRYVDKTAPPGATSYYAVTCANPAGASENSNEVAVTFAASGDGTVDNASRPPGAAQVLWKTLAPPTVANVTVQLPIGYTAMSAWNLVTRASVPVTTAAGTVTYPVSDDPVCLDVEPAPGP